MERWFTSYQGRWDLRTVRSHLNENFRREIASLVTQLDLEPKVGSPKKGLVIYNKDERNEIVVRIKKFTFDKFALVRPGDSYYTPVFNFDITVLAKKVGRVSRRVSGKDLVYDGPMIVTFPEDYPNEYPFFVLPKYRTFVGGAHSNHMYAGGKMCLFADFGRSTRAWDRTRDTSAVAFGVAMRWIVWHERDRERGVDADEINLF